MSVQKNFSLTEEDHKFIMSLSKRYFISHSMALRWVLTVARGGAMDSIPESFVKEVKLKLCSLRAE